MSEFVLRVENLTKAFRSAERNLVVVDHVSFAMSRGDSLSIIGPSGSGKTTLLGLCAGLDIPTSGTVSLLDYELNAMDEDDRAFIRNKHVGFVFQNFQLLSTLTALENVMVPLELRGEKNVGNHAREWLAKVGLEDRIHHYPTQLSGGEQQRVALARAFVTAPMMLFVDEPTGNLDEENANHIVELLFNLNKQEGTTLVMVTHNTELASRTGKIMRMRGGKIVEPEVIVP